ncbi:MAG: HEAT repeat domain-containing protein [Treponema sp.]|jgi:HEAT repeat protein|nr:HEAT repeat domain-containing protein [Treponema sp.]
MRSLTGFLGVPPFVLFPACAAAALLAAFLAVFIRFRLVRARYHKIFRSADLFKAFLACRKKGFLKKIFLAWMREEGREAVIRRLAASCGGEDFDGAWAYRLLGAPFVRGDPSAADIGAPLREMTGEPAWQARYFSYRLLLHNGDAGTFRSLKDGLSDSHPLIRKIITGGIGAAGGAETYSLLWDRLIRDPVYEVRETARRRIGKEFPGRYDPRQARDPLEAERLLELLDPASQPDRALAVEYLEHENPELRYPAAAFLDRTGVLAGILSDSSLDDPGGVKRNTALLAKALEAGVSGFLDSAGVPSGDRGDARTGAALLIAARLLGSGGGTGENADHLAAAVFSFFNGRRIESWNAEIYTLTLESIALKGSGPSLSALKAELEFRENQREFLTLLLPRLPLKASHLFLPVLFRFLHKPGFPAGEELIAGLCRFEPDRLLPEVFRILNGQRPLFPHPVRIAALKILAALRLPYCLGRVLESLPTLESGEIREIAPLLAGYPPEIFGEKVKTLLESPDGKIRACLLALLPAAGNHGFVRETRAGLRDADSEVRIAAIQSLLESGEIKLLNQETSLLRDPVEKVRVATARVIGQHGDPAALAILEELLTDPGEASSVKKSIAAGLGLSESGGSLEILIGLLEAAPAGLPEGLSPEDVYGALKQRRGKKDLALLIENFRDAPPPLREKLIPVFRSQGEEAEPGILALLEDEVLSLKPYLARILEETGYVEQMIRRLSARDVKVRREAARRLSLLGTLPCFRGLVTAARDPDQELRVLVVKALEKLKSPEGEKVLEELKEDPDRRVRRYTRWALERLEALKLE